MTSSDNYLLECIHLGYILLKNQLYRFRTAWYKGSVFYEISPLNFQDSNGDGFGDLQGLNNRIDNLSKLGVVGIRLNSIFPSNNHVTSLLEIDRVHGDLHNLTPIIRSLHDNNMSLILDLPIYPYLNQLEAIDTEFNEDISKDSTQSEDGSLRIARSLQYKNTVLEAMRQWINHGVDGFYVKGLEHFQNDPLLLENVRAWKKLLGPNRIIIISNDVIIQSDGNTAKNLLTHVDLVDVVVNIAYDIENIAKQINSSLEGVLQPVNGPYIQWSLINASERNATIAATFMSLMLPGTPSIVHDDEIILGQAKHQFSHRPDAKPSHQMSPMTWNTVPQYTMPVSTTNNFIANMIQLRDISPSIYQNVFRRHGEIKPNTSIKFVNGLLILERWYPRRNSFVSISNFSDRNITTDLSAMYYSGEVMVGNFKHKRIFFNKFEIGPIETLIVKLDK